MATRGPPPTPTPVLKARGSKRARTRAGEVQYTPGLPPPPAWLAAEGKAEWGRVAPELDRAGVLQRVDWAVFAAYCEAWAEFVALVEAMRPLTPAGAIAAGLSGAKRRCVADLNRLAQQFGFTPASRSRVQHGDSARKNVADARDAKFFA